MSSDTDKIDGWMLEQFQEKAPDLLELAESFTKGADDRWYIQGVADGPGWWGEDDGFFLDTTVDNPGYEGLSAAIWVGKDRVRFQLRSDKWIEADYLMDHDSLRAYLDSLPKPFTAYGVTEVEGE